MNHETAPKSRRRPKGDGHLLLRREGKWIGDRKARTIKDGVWYACYMFQGRKFRESSKPVGTRDAAARLLRKRLREIADGVFAPGAARVTLGHLRDLIVADYERNGRRTATRVWKTRKDGGKGGLFANLIRVLGEGATADRLPYSIEKYVTTRKEEGAENGTVNRELAALRRGYRLAIRARELAAMPVIELLEERNVRTGTFTEEDVQAIITHLQERLRGPIRFLWLTGWRAGEALRLEWRHVNTKEGEIRLEAHETKGRDVRILPYRSHPELAELIERRRHETEAWQREHGQVVPWVFWHVISDGALRNGGVRRAAPIRVYSHQWVDACKKAGLPGRRVHDLRRSFAVEAKRRGLEDGVVMALAGWKTRSVFDRYRIIDTKDLHDGMRRLGRPAPKQHQDEPQAATQANK